MSICPKCKGESSFVINTRRHDNRLLRRRRVCSCGERYSTLEVPLGEGKGPQEILEWAVGEALAQEGLVEEDVAHAD